jgi:hypothetical protein
MSANNAFDTNAFLNQTNEGGFETKYVKVEQGEYPAVIKKVDYRTLPKKDKPEENSHILDVTYFIDDARQKELTGMDEPTARQSIFLDVTADGKLDRSKNRNVNLGRLLEALGLNDRPNWSFNDFPGRPVMVKIIHSPNPKAADDPFVNVDKVGKMG